MAWFNKPKFHILVHLPDHIRRFGPAMLFATEGFESFNAVIRDKSVHSNCLAPSRDIALAFAQANRICHLRSKGLFYIQSTPTMQHLLSASNEAEFEEPVPQAKQSETMTDLTIPSATFKLNMKFSYQSDHWRHVGLGPEDLVCIPDTVTGYLGL